MITANIHEAKARLSYYLALVAEGETVVLCKRNVPIAELRPIEEKPKEPRKIGLLKGQFEVTDSFFEPLPDDLLALYNGESEKPSL